MFGILLRCTFLVLDAEKVMDEEVKSSAPEPEQSATGMNSKKYRINPDAAQTV